MSLELRDAQSSVTIKLGEASIDDYVLSAIVGFQLGLNEVGNGKSHIHDSDILPALHDKHPYLEFSHVALYDSLERMVERKVLLEETTTHGPSYKMNVDSLKKRQKVSIQS